MMDLFAMKRRLKVCVDIWTGLKAQLTRLTDTMRTINGMLLIF